MARKYKSTSSGPTETRVLAAVRDYRSGKFKNIRDAATAHDVTYGRLRNRLSGKGPKGEAHTNQQLLTPMEEKAIVGWILQLDKWGFPPRMKTVKDMATHFVRSHGIKNPTLGANWTTRFLARHYELESRFATRLDKQRGFASNPQLLQDFFQKLLSIVKTHDILPKDTYNMDEKGFLMGVSAAVKVICRRGKNRNFKAQDGVRELITVLETVSAAGAILPPMIVYKGTAQYQGWHALVKEGDKAFFSYSNTGWSNREIGLGYLVHNFETNTREVAVGRTRLLIMDGHTSHVAWEFFDYCLHNNIIPFCLPAHSTHLLQPLDVGLFGPLQRNYSSLLYDWLEGNGFGIHKGTFYPLLLQAREKTYTVKNIQSAFEATGISPYNPRRVLNALTNSKHHKFGKYNAEKAETCPGFTSSTTLPPRTPVHGKSILSHTRRTMALFEITPSDKIYRKLMVEKLAKVAAIESAENVILRAEVAKLREKNSKAKDNAKVKSKKVLTKALVVSAELVVKLRKEQEEKQRLADAKKCRALEQKEIKENKVSKMRKDKARVKKIPTITLGVDDFEGGNDSDEYSNYNVDSTVEALEVLTIGQGGSSGRVLRSHK